MMQEILILAILIFFAFGVLFFFINKRLTELLQKPKEDESQKLLVEWLKDMRGSLDKNLRSVQAQLAKSSDSLNKRLDNAARVIGDVQKHLGVMTEASHYLKDLHETLQAPKLRGNIGEQILNDILKRSIPQDSFKLQHQFRGGQIVDAIIEIAEGKIPIDSKFPIDSFKRYLAASKEEKERASKEFERGVKKHIDDIAKRYILPEEGTTDFAVMYIPSEPVAYEILVNFDDLVGYAHSKRVMLVSPNQFNNFLKTILLGFEKQKVGEQAKLILANLRAIRADATRFGEDLRLLTKHVGHAKSAADQATSSFSELSGKIAATQLPSGRTSPEKLSEPKESEKGQEDLGLE